MCRNGTILHYMILCLIVRQTIEWQKQNNKKGYEGGSMALPAHNTQSIY